MALANFALKMSHAPGIGKEDLGTCQIDLHRGRPDELSDSTKVAEAHAIGQGTCRASAIPSGFRSTRIFARLKATLTSRRASFARQQPLGAAVSSLPSR